LLVTAFIAVRSPVLLAALPSLVLRMVSNNSAFWGTSWHYNATLMPIVFIAAIDGLARIKASLAAGGGTSPARQRAGPGQGSRLGRAVPRYGAISMLAAGAVLAFHFPLTSLRSSATFQLGAHVSAENQAMYLVPDGATVATDLDLLAPLAARTDTFWLGNYGTNPPTQYVVFDAKNNEFQPLNTSVLAFVEQVIKGARYRQIYFNDGIYVFRRTS
jgi:uncharacterized membrane protein